MRYLHIAIAILAIAAVLTSAVMISEQDYADSTERIVISGNVVLHEDTVIPNFAMVVIEDGTSIDLSVYDLSIGKGAVVLVGANITLKSSGGAVVLKGGDRFTINDHVLPGLGEDSRITFTGTVALSTDVSTKEISVTFRPSGSDSAVHAEWGDNQLSVYNPGMHIRFYLNGIETKIGFSEAVLVDREYENGSLLRTTTTRIVSSDIGDALTIDIYYWMGVHGHLYLKDVNFSSITVTTNHAASGITDTMTMSGFSGFDASLDTETGILTVTAGIDRIDSEKRSGGTVLKRGAINNIEFTMELDLTVPYDFLYELIETGTVSGDLSRTLKRCDITVESAQFYDGSAGKTKRITGIVLSLSVSEDTGLVITLVWKDDDGSYKLTASGVRINALDIGLSLRVNLDVSVSDFKLSISLYSGSNKVVSITDLDLSIDDMDLRSLIHKAAATGIVDAQDLMDSCDRIRLSAKTIAYTYGGRTLAASDIAITLEKDARGNNTATLEFGSVDGSIRFKDGRVLGLDLGRSVLFVSGNCPITDLTDIDSAIDAFTTGSELTVGIRSESIGIDYTDSGATISIQTKKLKAGNGETRIDLGVAYSDRMATALADLSMSAHNQQLQITVRESGSRTSTVITAVETEIEVNDLDVGALRNTAGSVSAIGILDKARMVSVMADYAKVEMDDAEVRAESLGIRTDSGRESRLTFEAAALDAHASVDGSAVNVSSGSVFLSLSCRSSFSELMETIQAGLVFEKDASISIEAVMTGTSISFEGDGIKASFADLGTGKESHTARIDARLSHVERTGSTTADLSLSAEGYQLDADVTKDTGLSIKMTSPVVSLTGLDVEAVRPIVQGTAEPGLGMLDDCDSISVSASAAHISITGDSDTTFNAEDMSARTGSSGDSALHFSSGSLGVSLGTSGGTVSLKAASASVTLDSDMTFEEISDLIGGDMSFDSDAYLSLTAKLHGALLSYDDGNIEASLYADQGSQSDKMTVEAALKHRQNPSSTTLGMKMDATGHILKYYSTGIGYGKVPFEGKDLHVISSDPAYSIDGLDIDAVMSIIDRTGSIEVQDILDNCDGIALVASWARIDWDSDGVADALIDDCSAELNKGVGGTSMATMTMSEAEVDLPVDNADVYIHALSTEVSFRCDIPFSELVDLILNELDFTEDTDLDLSVTSGDLKMVVTTDDSTVELEMVNESADEDAAIALDLGIVYAEQKGRADLNGSLSALGFTTDVTVKSNDDDSGLIAIIIDLSLEMDDFDIVSAYRIIKETGTITMQQLLDCSDMLSLAATQTNIYNQSDASEEVNITGLQAVLSKNPKGQNTMTLGFDGLTTLVSKDDWVVGIFSGTSEILMVSDGSLTECIEVFTKGVTFTDDTSAEIKLSNESIRIEYTKDKDSVIFTNERLTDSSPRFATATMSLDYAEYDKSTKLAVSISSIGHKITFSDTSYVTKSDSNLHLTVSTEEVSGSLDVVFKDIVEFSANLSIPCEIRLEYTDVEFEVDTREAIISLTHGELDIDDYDYTEQGMLALIPSIKDSDFDLTTRLLMSAGSLIVYNSDHTAIVNSYGDAEVEVKKIAAEVKRNDSLSVTLDRLKLTTTDKSGKVNERDVDHLDILKDDTGTVPEKNWVERNSLYLALAFIAISIGMIVFLAHYHGKHPHKFRFKE